MGGLYASGRSGGLSSAADGGERSCGGRRCTAGRVKAYASVCDDRDRTRPSAREEDTRPAATKQGRLATGGIVPGRLRRGESYTGDRTQRPDVAKQGRLRRGDCTWRPAAEGGLRVVCLTQETTRRVSVARQPTDDKPCGAARGVAGVARGVAAARELRGDRHGYGDAREPRGARLWRRARDHEGWTQPTVIVARQESRSGDRCGLQERRRGGGGKYDARWPHMVALAEKKDAACGVRGSPCGGRRRPAGRR